MNCSLAVRQAGCLSVAEPSPIQLRRCGESQQAWRTRCIGVVCERSRGVGGALEGVFEHLYMPDGELLCTLGQRASP